MLAILTVSAAGALFFSYLVALRVGFRKALELAGSTSPAKDIHFSVVVAARNEAERLPALLEALAGQSHSSFEAVIVNDASDDATAEIVQVFAAQDARFRIEHVRDPAFPRKKHALARGIAAARFNRLAFTDADCTPGRDWLATLARYCDEERTIVTGFAPFRKEPTLLNRIVRYETLFTAFLTAGAVGLGRPYMAVGRNLSYHRTIFREIGGFSHSAASLSGDDDLLIQEAFKRGAGRIVYMADPAGFVLSDAPPTWRAWIRQKRRHSSAGRFYERGTKLHLGLFHASNIWLWSSPLWLGWPGAAVIAGKWLMQGIMLRPASVRLQQNGLMPLLPFLDLAYLLYNLFIASTGLLSRPSRW